MFRRAWIGSFGWLLLGAASCSAPTATRHEFTQPAMGTQFRVVLYAPDAELARVAAEAAFARIRELDRRLSDYSPASELTLFSHSSDGDVPGPWVDLSDDLWHVLASAETFSRSTDGAFDVTAGPIVELWRRARRQGELPRAERLAQALQRVSFSALELDPTTHRARLLRNGMRLDLGAIAKGFALDQALAVLAEHGCERALVDDGGGVTVAKAPPGARGWRVVLEPSALDAQGLVLELEHASVATSGDRYQALELDGQRYSHIVDPRTGQALRTRTSACVVARDGLTADACATAACVLGFEPALAWAHARGDIELRIVRETEHGLETALTPGLERLILSSPLSPAPTHRP